MSDDVDVLRASVAALTAERDALVQAHEMELSRIRSEARESAVTSALRSEAIRLGAHDADAVIALMDRSGISWSDAGGLSGVEDAMNRAREARGFLFREERIGLPGSTGVGTAPRPAPAQAQDARLLPQQDYAARKRQFLAGII
ncbi:MULTISPECIES: phage scaffolding protein [unclassified Asaia]|uniref:phage scaffolding protein n=1 Tax=unclassified Asaia TaxID=2685023 RepID=UPI0013154BE5